MWLLKCFLPTSSSREGGSYLVLALAMWIQSTVTPKLVHCNADYMDLLFSLETPAGAECRWGRACILHPFSHSVDLVISCQVLFKGLVIAYKALHGLGPTYLQDLLSCYAMLLCFAQTASCGGGWSAVACMSMLCCGSHLCGVACLRKAATILSFHRMCKRGAFLK